MKLIPYGSKSWMVRWNTREEFEQVYVSILEHLSSTPPSGFLECIPGYQTLLLAFKAPYQENDIRKYLKIAATKKTSGYSQNNLIEIPVQYNGPDLSYIAEFHNISTDDVIQRHSDTVYTIYFMGFSPGFPYLGPLDSSLHTPRRKSPRTRIPAGSVAIGGSHTGIYSVESPGGWHIIGHTSKILFNLNAAIASYSDSRDIFHMHPGDQIRFIPQSTTVS
ncbi:MAG: 5-oxoprolinase subunit PxpB [Verrucomicrobiota bacterium]